MIQIAYEDGKVEIFDLFNTTINKNELKQRIKTLLASDDLKIFHNSVFDLKMLRAWLGERLEINNIFDTMLASQLVNAGNFIPAWEFNSWLDKNGITKGKQGNRVIYADKNGFAWKFNRDTGKQKHVRLSHALDQVTYRYLRIILNKEEQLADWSGELSQEQINYAAKDSAVLLHLQPILQELLRKNGLEKVARLEFETITATAEKEFIGMPFDLVGMEKLKQETQKDILAQTEILDRYGEFNPNSPAQVKKIMQELAPEKKITSTDKEVLKLILGIELDSELGRFCTSLLDYKTKTKLAGYYSQWRDAVNPTTKRIHACFMQLNRAGVGRYASFTPNLQQVPRDATLRSLFRTPAESGRTFVIADYSGIEMRIMAQLAQDETLIDAFKSGEDVHIKTAAGIAQKPASEVSKAERQAAKALNFGLIYGMSAKTLKIYAETSYGVTMSEEEAKKARTAFFELYPGIEAWQARQIKKQWESGFGIFWTYSPEAKFKSVQLPLTRTLSGRLRVWPKTQKTSKRGREYLAKVGAVTEIYNTPDQGTGADILKRALALLYDRLRERGWDDTHICLSVHDEIVLETSGEKAEDVKVLLEETMIEAGREFVPDVPIEVESVISPTWKK
ncbi:DNA polymerase [candidate division NPL-UPA2 bacterium]|nr:DNA polymerase [candidate division NPL-UPA2 bacterium]